MPVSSTRRRLVILIVSTPFARRTVQALCLSFRELTFVVDVDERSRGDRLQEGQ